MSILKMDLTLLENLARRSGIALEFLADADYRDRRLNSPSGNAGLCLERRVVYYNKEAMFEQVLHEIAHVITAPPGIDYETVPEDFLLMQLERCICTELPRRLTTRVVDWQLETCAPLLGPPDEELGNLEGYETEEAWLAGYRRARELGLVDERNRPTYDPPAWTPTLLREVQQAVDECGLGEP